MARDVQQEKIYEKKTEVLCYIFLIVAFIFNIDIYMQDNLVTVSSFMFNFLFN